MLPRAIMNMLKQVKKKKTTEIFSKELGHLSKEKADMKKKHGNFRTEQYNHRNIELSGSLTADGGDRRKTVNWSTAL